MIDDIAGGNLPLPGGDTRLPYFPKAFPEEIVYSILARYARHMGFTSADRVSAHLFEVGRRRHNVDFSSRLGLLSSRLPADHELDADTLLNKHTTFPYYSAFMSSERRAAAVAARLEPNRSASFSYNGWKWLAADHRLRFCPKCVLEMMHFHGELYWRRDHQIPTVLVCPTHGEVLRFACTSNYAKRHFCPATPFNCPEDAPSVVEGLTERERITLHSIATRSAFLLQPGDGIVSMRTDPERFRILMLDKGFLGGEHRTNLPLLKAKLQDVFGHLERIWPNVFVSSGMRGSGSIMRMRALGAEVNDPLFHIMMSILLDESPDVPAAAQPKAALVLGRGPWACPNPFAEHTSALPVRSVVWSDGRTRFTNRFECHCGCVFIRTSRPNGSVSEPTVREFGPTLRLKLISAKSSGLSMRKAALKLGLSRCVLRNQAKLLGLAQLWETSEEQGRLPRVSKAPLQSDAASVTSRDHDECQGCGRRSD